MTIEKILDWAWIHGLDVYVYSRSFEMSPTGMRDTPDFHTHESWVKGLPCIRFSKNDKHIEVTARNWAEMKEQLKHKCKHIFAELHCQPIGDEKCIK